MTRTVSKHRNQSGGGRHGVTQILQAAIDLFAKGGSRGTCIAAIADRIGVTPAAVIHHFKTKDGLLREVVGEIERRRPVLVDYQPSGPDILRGRAIGVASLNRTPTSPT